MDGAEPMIIRSQSGPKGDLWICEDGPNHVLPQHVHAGLMLLTQDYLSLQDRLKSAQHALDEEVKENQHREAVIWKLETALRRRKAKLAKMRRELGSL